MSYWENNGQSDEWYTPQYIFDALECEFDTDVAAPIDKTFCCVPAKSFITENSLSASWEGFIWCNPPFGGRNGIEPWAEKVIKQGTGIILTPDRTSTAWWQKLAHRSHEILFIHGKVKFIRPDGSEGKSPSNGTTLFGFGENAIRALHNAQKNRLGIICKSSLEY